MNTSVNSVDTDQDDDSGGRWGILVAYIVIAAVGAAFFIGSFQYSYYRTDIQVGPGYLPRYAGALLMVLGLLLVIQAVQARKDSAPTLSSKGLQAFNTSEMRKLALVFTCIVISLLLVPVLGLIVALGLLVATLTIVVERMPAIPSALFSAGAAVVAYVVFIVVLRVPLPMGIFEGII